MSGSSSEPAAKPMARDLERLLRVYQAAAPSMYAAPVDSGGELGSAGGLMLDGPQRARPVEERMGFTGPVGALTPQAAHDRDIALGFAGSVTPKVPPIRAFHGSPHVFDRFDMRKIGTGEGAQAYGQGLYFAGSEDVARGYRDALSRGLVHYKGTTPAKGTLEDAIAAYTAKHGSPEGGMAALRSELAKYPQFKNDVARLDGGEFSVRDFKIAPGSMYEVALRTTPERLLDWDKPMGAQPAAVQEALKSLPAGEFYLNHGGLTGSQVAPKTLKGAARLRRAGIDGLQYLDGGSRATGEGSRNYVMFDAALIDILRRYGLAAMTGTAAAAAAPVGDN